MAPGFAMPQCQTTIIDPYTFLHGKISSPMSDERYKNEGFTRKKRFRYVTPGVP